MLFKKDRTLTARSRSSVTVFGIHLNDLEAISRRVSHLGGLYDLRRGFVRHCIEGLERAKRDLISGKEPGHCDLWRRSDIDGIGDLREFDIEPAHRRG